MKQETLAIIKPNVVQKNKIGEIISIVERNNFKIKDLKLVKMDEERAKQFYKEHLGKDFLPSLVEFMTSERVIVLRLEKENAINNFRDLIGATNYKEASIGTIRYMYADSLQANAVHGSDSEVSAKREIDFFFNK